MMSDRRMQQEQGQEAHCYKPVTLHVTCDMSAYDHTNVHPISVSAMCCTLSIPWPGPHPVCW